MRRALPAGRFETKPVFLETQLELAAGHGDRLWRQSRIGVVGIDRPERLGVCFARGKPGDLDDIIRRAVNLGNVDKDVVRAVVERIWQDLDFIETIAKIVEHGLPVRILDDEVEVGFGGRVGGGIGIGQFDLDAACVLDHVGVVDIVHRFAARRAQKGDAAKQGGKERFFHVLKLVG